MKTKNKISRNAGKGSLCGALSGVAYVVVLIIGRRYSLDTPTQVAMTTALTAVLVGLFDYAKHRYR